MHGLALCAGIGGIELGLKLVNPGYQTVCYVEGEAYAATVLVLRAQEKALDEAPIWSNIKSFDGIPWRGCVDIITAGFPCQPWSDAGTKGGMDDDRWLWPDIARIIKEVEPTEVFIENVPGLLGGGIEPVLQTLAEMGYDAAWGRFSARGVGAPHRRFRFFLLARLANTSMRRCDETIINLYGREQNPAGEGEGEGVGNTHGDGRATGSEGRIPPEEPHPGRKELGNADSEGLEGRRFHDLSFHTYQLPTWPSSPEDRDAWERILQEWPEVEPAICGVADGSASWVDRLRACGNAVVPVMAATAYRHLGGILDGR
jgi:DNA (cytosine-5)-methyltransferase 1